MKHLIQHDFNHTLGFIVTAASAATAKAAVYAPAPPSWLDVVFGCGGGVLGAVIMVVAMQSLRAGRSASGVIFLVAITAAWSGLASAFTAAMMLESVGLMDMSGPVATMLGGSVAAMGALAIFPLLMKLIGWVSRNVDMLAEALVRRIGGGR